MFFFSKWFPCFYLHDKLSFTKTLTGIIKQNFSLNMAVEEENWSAFMLGSKRSCQLQLFITNVQLLTHAKIMD